MRNLNTLFGPEHAPEVLAGLATAYAALLGQPETHRILLMGKFGFGDLDSHSPLEAFTRGWVQALDDPTNFSHRTEGSHETELCALAAACYTWRMVLPPKTASRKYFSACSQVFQRLGFTPPTYDDGDYLPKGYYLPLAWQEKRFPLPDQAASGFWRDFNLSYKDGARIRQPLIQEAERLIPHSSAALIRQA